MDEVGPVGGASGPLPTGGPESRPPTGAAGGQSARRAAAKGGATDGVDLSAAARLATDPAAAAQRAAALVKAMAPGSAPVDVRQLAQTLQREGVVPS